MVVVDLSTHQSPEDSSSLGDGADVAIEPITNAIRTNSLGVHIQEEFAKVFGIRGLILDSFATSLLNIVLTNRGYNPIGSFQELENPKHRQEWLSRGKLYLDDPKRLFDFLTDFSCFPRR